MSKVSKKFENLPFAVIGAGPVGLAAAAHIVDRGMTPLILERGSTVGTSLRAWGHVRVFSPWRYNIDAAARNLLESVGWTAPDPDDLPTGAEIVRDYLEPLAAHPALAPHLRLGANVEAITRAGFGKVVSGSGAAAPQVVAWIDAEGLEHRTPVRAVIDASGTWDQPNPMGADGLLVRGERVAGDRIAYGIPDVLGAERGAYADRRVLIVGGGHSAINAALNLLRLRESAPATQVYWALRRDRIDRLLGGGLNDQLPARGELGLAARQAIDTGRLKVLAPYAAKLIERTDDGLRVTGLLGNSEVSVDVDRIVVATGQRPDLEMLRELRVEFDSTIESTPALAPLIDPRLHSCGTVPPHGARELAHPEPDFYVVGSKSYGRAPTFLMLTGYEQVRSVVAEIAGDHVAAQQVRLALPETGVCTVAPVGTASGCCGGAAPKGVDACCADDAAAKASGRSGCGCSDTASPASG